MTKQDSLHKALSTVLVYDIIVVVISELALDLAVIIPNFCVCSLAEGNG